MSKKPVVQGGVDNYLGKQPQVVVPRKWQSSPDAPPTELAYITKAEKDLILKKDIHGSLSKGPNMGPSGIMSLDSFGDVGGAGAAGGDTEETGAAMDGRGFSGKGPNETQSQFDSRVRNQKEIMQKAEQRQAERLGYRERQNIVDRTRKFGKVGSGIRSLFSTALGFINPALGLLSRGLPSLRDFVQGLRGFNPDGTPMSQDDYEKARQDRINQSRIDNILNRDAPITEMTQRNLEKLGYTGEMPGVGSTPTSRAIDRDFINDPEMPQFATSYLKSLQPAGTGTNFPGANRLDLGLTEVPGATGAIRSRPDVNLLAQPAYNLSGTVRPDSTSYLTDFDPSSGQFTDDRFGLNRRSGLTGTKQFDDSPYGNIGDYLD